MPVNMTPAAVVASAFLMAIPLSVPVSATTSRPQSALAVTATTTTLKATAPKVRRGDRVGLIARVTDPAGNPVRSGLVTFWAMGVGETRYSRIGSADLTPKGTATKRIRVKKTKWYSAILQPTDQLAKSWSPPIRVLVK